jgi:hypothetical protein
VKELQRHDIIDPDILTIKVVQNFELISAFIAAHDEKKILAGDTALEVDIHRSSVREYMGEAAGEQPVWIFQDFVDASENLLGSKFYDASLLRP